MANSEINKRDFSLELMRIIAIFFVVFIHTGDSGYFLFSTFEVGSFWYWFYMPISIFSNFAVPIFFMISGAVLLKKEESITTILKKRVLRIGIDILAVNLIYYVFDLINGNIPFLGFSNLIDFGMLLLSGKIRPFIWFLYSYLVFLILLPFLRKVVKLASIHEYKYLFCVSIIIMSVKPVFELLSLNHYELNNAFNTIISNILLYPLLGYCIYYQFDEKRIRYRKLGLLWIMNVIGVAISCLLCFYRMTKTGETTETQAQQFHSMISIFNSSLLFITIKKICSSAKIYKVKKAVLVLGECVFGVYLFHVLFMNLNIMDSIKNVMVSNTVFPLTMCLLYCVIIFSLSMLLTFLMKRIPIIRRYL